MTDRRGFLFFFLFSFFFGFDDDCSVRFGVQEWFGAIDLIGRREPKADGSDDVKAMVGLPSSELATEKSRSYS